MATAFQATTRRNRVYTTGQIAKLTQVAPRTVSKWFDSGRLKGYRIPGSQDRRVPEASLLRFLQEHGLPTDELEHAIYSHVLIISEYRPMLVLFEELILDTDHWRVMLAPSAFVAGAAFYEHRPHVVAVDLALGRTEAERIAQALAGETTLIAFSGVPVPSDFHPTGFDALVATEDLVREIRARVQR